MSSNIPDSPNLDLIDAYLAGELSGEPQARIEKYLVNNPEWFEASEHLRNLEFDRNLPRLNRDLESEWMRVKGRMDVGVTGSHTLPVAPTSSRSFNFSKMAVALSLCLVLVGAGWYLKSLNGPYVASDSPQSSWVYSTKDGERATVELPDGSTVVLNVGSRLEIPSTYLTSNRSVRLTGEALFTIVPNPGQAFSVITTRTTTKVLGTTFKVREYPMDTVSTVAVQEGKVMVGETVLAATQMATARSNNDLVVHSIEKNVFGFVNGLLVIDDVPLKTAILDLNRWYNADIRLGDPVLKERRIVGSYESGSITDLISIMELTLNVRIVRDGRTLTFYPRG